jgi:hypothetical protein
MEHHEEVQSWPKVPEDPYELPPEPLFPPPEFKTVVQGGLGAVQYSLISPRPLKVRVSFVTTDKTLNRIRDLCRDLDTQRSDVIRASLEMALPVFENHPEMFNYFANLARRDW